MPLPPDQLDGRFGEAWAGEVPNGSHINLAVGRRGSPTAAAAAAAMTTMAPGHAPFICCLGAGYAVRPITIVRNKATAIEEGLALVTWGAAQLGIGRGVMDAVDAGLFDRAALDEVVLLVAVWVDPAAHDHTAVQRANREAMRVAIEDALSEDRSARVAELLARRETGRNAFYRGD